MNKITTLGYSVYSRLDQLGDYVALLGIRIILAYEYFESGWEKYSASAENIYFKDLSFPFPFSVLSPNTNWFLATWFELIGAIAILIGLATRFVASSLIVLTIVAWITVHAGKGYTISEGGFKLSLIFIVMFIPLVFKGAGKLSIDELIKRFWHKQYK